MGSVLNVVDFGAFVDIGLHDSGLVHISQLSRRYVRDPHDVVSVGQVVTVWVLELDKNRRRVALTMIPPGAPPPQAGRPAARRDRPQRDRSQQRDRSRSAVAADGQSQAGTQPRRRGKPPGPGGRRGMPQTHEPRRPRVPPPPITEAMREGREPLRTFGDLMQFFETKEKPAAAGEISEKPGKRRKRRRRSARAREERAAEQPLSGESDDASASGSETLIVQEAAATGQHGSDVPGEATRDTAQAEGVSSEKPEAQGPSQAS
jgi:predicted RNA-binding protein with RPS1 domain